MRDAAGLADALARQAPALVTELLPAGRREGGEWRVGSIRGEPGHSLGVRLFGAKAGVWQDFSTGDGGDALDLVAAVLYRGDKRAAMIWARAWLGLGDAPGPPPRQAAKAAARAAADTGADERRGAALRLFLAAEERIAGTPPDFYLAARGIRLAELGRQPRALRYAPALWNVESQRHWPALVAAVTGFGTGHLATHRQWLQLDAGGVWRKAPLATPKMTLGSPSGGAIPLWRGASGKPLAQAPAGETLAVAEGLETALSVALACPELRVVCAVSLPNMSRLVLPPTVATIIVCADNDGDNEAARRGLDRAVEHFAAEGRAVRIARAPIGKDFNDTLQATDA